MADVAGQIGMSVSQRKFTVIKTGRQPANRCVASFTGSPKLSFMFIILRMAAITIGGRALENVIYMTAGAWYAGMLANQLKT